MAGTVVQRDGTHDETSAVGPTGDGLEALERLAHWLEPTAPTACPYCAATRLHRWGWSKRGRPRLSCRGCRRTFSAATGTIVLRLREPGKLRALLTEMVGGATRSCRTLAAELGWGKNTVWRWRSAIMAALETLDVPAPGPIAAADLHIVRESRKASREWARHAADPSGSPAPDRPRWIDVDSARQQEPQPRDRYRVPMLVVLDAGQGWRAERSAGHASGVSSVADGLPAGCTIEATPGADVFARGARHATKPVLRRPAVVDASDAPPLPGSPGERLRRFLRPFRGPATRHLPGYLAWFTATRPAAAADHIELAWTTLLSLRPTRFEDMRAASP